MGPRDGLVRCGKSRFRRNSIPGPFSPLPVAIPTTLPGPRPDRVLHDKKEKTCLLIGIAITNDSNFNTRETEKLSKCKDLEIEVSRMWKVRTKIVPVVIVGSGTIKRGFDQNLQLLSGHLLVVTELQKVTLMGTVHLIKVLG